MFKERLLLTSINIFMKIANQQPLCIHVHQNDEKWQLSAIMLVLEIGILSKVWKKITQNFLQFIQNVVKKITKSFSRPKNDVLASSRSNSMRFPRVFIYLKCTRRKEEGHQQARSWTPPGFSLYVRLPRIGLLLFPI